MSYRFPDSIVDSSDDEITFHSPENSTMSGQNNQQVPSNEGDRATRERHDGSSIPQEQPNLAPSQSGPFDLSNIPPEVYQAIFERATQQILNSAQNFTASVAPPPPILRKTSKWPAWDGSNISFEAHVFNLKVKIEEDKLMLGSDRSICLNIFNSIPT